MVTNRLWAVAFLLMSGAAWSREAASVTDCQSAVGKPAIANAKAAVDRAPNDLTANFGLADAWSDAGCFGDAVQVLQGAQAQHPGNKELETRLRVARSLVGEEHYFDTLDRADAEARLKRDTFRCSNLSDPEACNEAVRLRRAAALAPGPELAATGGAAEPQSTPSRTSSELREEAPESHRPVPAGTAASTTHAAAAAGRVEKPIRVARGDSTAAAVVPVRHYSNAPQDERSH